MAQRSSPYTFDFTGRAVVVTGAGRGLGAAIARRFAEAGASVAVNYRSGAREAAALVEEIRAATGRGAAGPEARGRVEAIRADVTRPEEVEELFREAVERLGRLDVLVNNAGTYPVTALLETTAEEWEAVVDANLRSVHLCTRAAARRMADAGEGGSIVNIASIEGEAPMPGHAHYASAKAGVLMYTRAAAAELGPRGIRVNAVSPGLIWREGIEADWPEGVERWNAASPLGRLGRPEEVADACLFLASPAARWVTGANLRVDGGVMSRPAF